MERQFGAVDYVVIVTGLLLLSAASLWFAQLVRSATGRLSVGRGARLFFLVAAWLASLGAIASWACVLAERLVGPLLPFEPLSLVVAFNLAAPPLTMMHNKIRNLGEQTG